ncbi:MAG: hypothetical protein KatS3mg031_0918 [Chitinophagales bacterium]|nr:MAG: hypothetical protein KatS3mg031_0918 [Chitinophagales bacterium]
MKTMIIALFPVVALLFSCSSGSQEATEKNTVAVADTTGKGAGNLEDGKAKGSFENLLPGMSADEVVAMLGKPTQVDSLDSNPDTVIEDWWYGDNQKIRMINGKVNRIVKDVKREQEILKKIVEAKKKKDEAEVRRLMEELTGN